MTPFSLLVKPVSADCNLRCEYCFYLEKCALYPDTQRHRMSDEVLKRIISTFLATPQPQHSIGWQGGEPTLMGVKFFRKVTAFQEKYGARGVSVSNGLQTNATLIDDEFAARLAKYNFLVGVSIDGPEDVHNRYRKYTDGSGAHAAVLKGLEALRRNRVEYNVLTLVSQANVKKPVEVYRYLCGMGVMFHQYIECVEFDSQGHLRPFAVGGEEWGDFLCAVYDEWIKQDTRRVSIRLFDSILTMMVENVANCCTMSRDCRQYFLVEYNGDVYPCDFYVESELKLGNVRENSWKDFLSSPVYEEFGRRKSRWSEACADCEYLKYCAGCCPKNRPARGGDPSHLSVLCEGWKKFYAHTLSGFRELADAILLERNQASIQAGIRPRLNQV
ncbi:MAG: anaerobic sulfatase maturase [Lentisphaerae bacterium]|nr:anaerobic sulfatase maturase [Lentisphaerota bacterium]